MISIDKILQAFSKIEPGEKYYVSENKSYKQNSFSFIYRKLFEEDRVKTVNYISSVMSSYHNDDKLFSAALTGIENLSKTYANDPEICGKLLKIVAEGRHRLDINNPSDSIMYGSRTGYCTEEENIFTDLATDEPVTGDHVTGTDEPMVGDHVTGTDKPMSGPVSGPVSGDHVTDKNIVSEEDNITIQLDELTLTEKAIVNQVVSSLNKKSPEITSFNFINLCNAV